MTSDSQRCVSFHVTCPAKIFSFSGKSCFYFTSPIELSRASSVKTGPISHPELENDTTTNLHFWTSVQGGLKSWTPLKPLGALQVTLEPWIYSLDASSMTDVNWFAPIWLDTCCDLGGALAEHCGEADKPCSKAWQFSWDCKTVAKRCLITSLNCLWKLFISESIRVLNIYIAIIIFLPMVITCLLLQGVELIFRHQKCLLHILNVEGKLIHSYGIWRT